MKFLVAASSFPRDANDYAGRFVLDFSRALARRGHETFHLVPEAGNARGEEDLERGVSVRRFRFAPFGMGRDLVYGQGIEDNLRRHPQRMAAIPFLMRAFDREIGEALRNDPSLVLLSHWVLPAGLAAAKHREKHPQLRHLGIVHGGAAQRLASQALLRPLLRRWSRGTDAAVFVSDDLRRRCAHALGSFPLPPSIVRPMGVDSDVFRTRGRRDHFRARHEVAPDQLLIAAVGRLVPLKGFDLLIQSLEGVDGVTLLLAGSGPEKDRLSALARSLHVSVQFLGRQSQEGVAEIMEASDLFVLPSRRGARGRSEGLPVALLEALMMGLPVIASQTGGVPEVIRDGHNGLLFPEEDRGALRGLILRLRDAPFLGRDLALEAKKSAEAFGMNETAACAEELLARTGIDG